MNLIIVAYRKPELLRAYLQGLEEHENVDVILVDVAPEGGPPDFDLTYIPLEKANYSQAVNAGLSQSHSEYIVWGNEDLQVDGPFVDQLLAPIKEDPKTLTSRWVKQQLGKPFVVGCLVAMHRDALSDIGYLDERFPGTWEDVDYSWRAVKAGYRLVKAHIPVQHMALGRLNTNMGACKRLFMEKWGL